MLSSILIHRNDLRDRNDQVQLIVETHQVVDALRIVGQAVVLLGRRCGLQVGRTSATIVVVTNIVEMRAKVLLR